MSTPRTSCSDPRPSFPATLLLIALAVGLVFVVVSITELVKEQPPPPRNPSRPKPRARRSARGRVTTPPSTDPPVETTADRLEAMAEVTGRYQQAGASTNPRTVTGRLTLAAWLSRWWASGSYMQRRLIVSVITGLLTVAALFVVLALLGS